MESPYTRETFWHDDFTRPGDGEDFSPGKDEVVWSPEGFYPLRVGMSVRHPKFGEGKVRAVEGMDEDQKVTVLFKAEGPKRLKVRYANLEILEG